MASLDNPTAAAPTNKTLYSILIAISVVHLLNDSIQSVIPAIIPILRDSLGLSLTQLGLVIFTLNITASILQPVVGIYTDARPAPFILPVGMAATLIGMLGLAFAPSFGFVLASVFMVGIGSAVFHPEGARVAHMASGGRKGTAQSIFQVGGNAGQALAPLMTIFIFVPLGQFGSIWFTLVALLACILLLRVSMWYRNQLIIAPRQSKRVQSMASIDPQRRRQILFAMGCILFYVFARSWYYSGIASFYPIYLIDIMGLTIKNAQLYTFCFLFAGAVGTFLGGPLADRFGKKNLIIIAMLGAAPFALILPHAAPGWAAVICLFDGLIILSSFSVMVVYAQELIPGKIGTVSGLIIGLAFGMGALGGASLGKLADHYGIAWVMDVCSYLPLLGAVAFLLPSDQTLRKWRGRDAA